MYLTVRGYFEEAFADGRVLSGCFAGMRYVTESICSTHSPKLLGTYEKELYTIIDAVPTASYSTIVNVGAGEGYFAVGLARQNPGVPVIAFDLDPHARKLLGEMAELNNVRDQITIRGHCHCADLEDTINGSTFVCMDAEGDERVLLDPEQVPGLLEADIVVEIHDFLARDIADAIRGRFYPTHHIREIWQEDRSYVDLPQPPSRGQRLFWELTLQRPYHYMAKALSEGRPERMRWLHLERHRDHSEARP